MNDMIFIEKGRAKFARIVTSLVPGLTIDGSSFRYYGALFSDARVLCMLKEEVEKRTNKTGAPETHS